MNTPLTKPRTATFRRDSTLLWASFRTGNREALAVLYEHYFSSLHKYGMLVCRDPELVNDCIHELFSKLWTQRERLGMAQNVRQYLSRSLERIIVAQLLRNKKVSSDSSAVDCLFSDSFEQCWIDGELRKERLSEIKKCLKSLPKCQREVILLKFFNDLTYAEISEIMGLQVPSVYNLASKAIDHLRQMIHPEPAAA